MKFKLNTLLIGLSTVLLSSSAMATSSDVALDATGEILESSCDVEIQDTTGTAITSLAVGGISEAQVFSTALSNVSFAVGVTTDFQLAFSNCVNTAEIDISFTLGTQTGTAVGVDLVLLESSAEADSNALANFDLSGANSGVKTFGVGYKKTAATNDLVEIGTAARTISFTAEYL
ncbi:fimbrial protein [Shewanella sp. 10N.286.45.A1]|uniref:fimbrial protein n=1 Tax=Shewanella sp. 10N.286.45.A1 TaxID=3229694 RepID=UPI00354DF9A1